MYCYVNLQRKLKLLISRPEGRGSSLDYPGGPSVSTWAFKRRGRQTNKQKRCSSRSKHKKGGKRGGQTLHFDLNCCCQLCRRKKEKRKPGAECCWPPPLTASKEAGASVPQPRGPEFSNNCMTWKELFPRVSGEECNPADTLIQA